MHGNEGSLTCPSQRFASYSAIPIPTNAPTRPPTAPCDATCGCAYGRAFCAFVSLRCEKSRVLLVSSMVRRRALARDLTTRGLARISHASHGFSYQITFGGELPCQRSGTPSITWVGSIVRAGMGGRLKQRPAFLFNVHSAFDYTTFGEDLRIVRAAENAPSPAVAVPYLTTKVISFPPRLSPLLKRSSSRTGRFLLVHPTGCNHGPALTFLP